jgi:hypothetical protein
MSRRDEPIEEELAAIRPLCSGPVTYHEDGWRQAIHIPGLRIPEQGQHREVDALLVLNHDNPNYPTKLYLAEQLGCGLNWNESHYILGRHWYTFSWSNVPMSLPAIEILAIHLAQLKLDRAA